jgi:hypothetical protein
VTDPIKVESHNEVLSWVNSRKALGTFKRCDHLKVVPLTYHQQNEVPLELFIPECECASFEWKAPCHGDRQMAQKVLVWHLDEDPISCPANCLKYASERWARVRERVNTLCAFAHRYLAVPFQWFAKLPWQTQIAIVVVGVGFGVLKLTPQWVPQIIKLLNAYRGK